MINTKRTIARCLCLQLAAGALVLASVTGVATAQLKKPQQAFETVSPNVEINGMKVEFFFDAQSQLALRVTPPTGTEVNEMTVFWIPAAIGAQQGGPERAQWRRANAVGTTVVLAPFETVRNEIIPSLQNAKTFSGLQKADNTTVAVPNSRTEKILGVCAVLNINALCDRIVQTVARLPAAQKASAFPLQEQAEIWLKVQTRNSADQGRNFEGSGYVVFYSSVLDASGSGNSRMRVNQAPPPPVNPTIPMPER